jgi:hypothetical protein
VPPRLRDALHLMVSLPSPSAVSVAGSSRLDVHNSGHDLLLCRLAVPATCASTAHRGLVVVDGQCEESDDLGEVVHLLGCERRGV